MTTSSSNFNRSNLSDTDSDVTVLMKQHKERVLKDLANKEGDARTPFISFAEKRLNVTDLAWLKENQERFFINTPNEELIKLNYLSQLGYITCMIYSPDGEHIIVGHSTGLIQTILLVHIQVGRDYDMDDQKYILNNYAKDINSYYRNEKNTKTWYYMFTELKKQNSFAWINENHNRFLKGTRNEILYNRWYFPEMGAITALAYSPNGSHIIVGHSSGLIQMRHGATGVVLTTLRNIQFPPKPVYALKYSITEERVCYAACMDGAIYRIEIPNVGISLAALPEFCIKADPAAECLTMQFFGSPGLSSYSTPLITQRSPALCVDLTADESKIIVGYADTSIKVYDKETQEDELTYKVHKLRLQFIPKKLQRMHSQQVCALRCHSEKPYMFASGAWDKTLRIWDIRCKVGCMMTFEGVDVCSDSIDLNRDHCLCGSWQPTEALTVWDLVAKKKLNVIRVQNRRPDVDGEYIYACRYWRSKTYNRKGKYAIIGGSGTNCVEVINLHNRYITCSYPCEGSVLAISSFQERIAFGGTAPTLHIVSFYDPKHEKYVVDDDSDFDYGKGFDQGVTLYDSTRSLSHFSKTDFEGLGKF